MVGDVLEADWLIMEMRIRAAEQELAAKDAEIAALQAELAKRPIFSPSPGRWWGPTDLTKFIKPGQPTIINGVGVFHRDDDGTK